MTPSLPKYNAPIPYGLDYEYKYQFINDKIYRKGAKYHVDFKVSIIPENLELVDNRYTYDKAAREEAMEWMRENQEIVYIYWWGPDHVDPEKVENIKVKFRDYQEVSWPVDLAFYRTLLRGPYTPSIRGFAAYRMNILHSITNRPSLTDQLDQWIKRILFLPKNQPTSLEEAQQLDEF